MELESLKRPWQVDKEQPRTLYTRTPYTPYTKGKPASQAIEVCWLWPIRKVFRLVLLMSKKMLLAFDCVGTAAGAFGLGV